MSNPVGAVFDAIGSVAEFVVDNALPIIETVALSSVLGPAGLGLSELTSNVISRVAVTALNGGSIGSIAAAGLTPMIPSIGKSIGINLDAGSYLSKPIADVISNPTIAKIVSSAAGSAVTGGVVAAVTGGDILQSAAMAGLSTATSQALSKTWDTIKQNAPALEAKQTQLQQMQDNLSQPQNQQVLTGIQNFENSIKATYDQITGADPNSIRAQYDKVYAEYNAAKAAGNVSLANSYAAQLNNDIVPALNTFNEINVPTYQTQVSEFNKYLDANKSLIDQAMQADSLSNQIYSMGNQISASNANFNMMDALQKGDFTAAVKAYQDLNTYNSDMLKADPNAIAVTPSLDTNQLDLLNKISSAADDATKNQLISQAKLNQGFADMMSQYKPSDVAIPTDTTSKPTTTTDTTTQPTTQPVDTTTQPTTQPTTPAAPPPSTFDVSKLSPIADKLQTAFGNAIKQGFISNLTGQIIGGITGNTPGTTKPSVSLNRPAQHVDVSTLKPFTGTLPANLQTVTNTGQPAQQTQPAGGLTAATTTNVATAPTTPTTPTTNQPTTGGLNAVTQPQNVVADTSTQTPVSGLQSTAQPQTTATSTAPKKVDISTLSPVTDTNMLKNLGLQIG